MENGAKGQHKKPSFAFIALVYRLHWSTEKREGLTVGMDTKKDSASCNVPKMIKVQIVSKSKI